MKYLSFSGWIDDTSLLVKITGSVEDAGVLWLSEGLIPVEPIGDENLR